MIPFTQTQMWAGINSYYNALEPRIIGNSDIYCLFGYDKKNASWTSFGGPIFFSKPSIKNLTYILSTILEKAKKDNIYSINLRSLFPLRKWEASIETEFIKFGFTHQKWETLIIDLNSPEEVIYKNFKHSARKGIKKAQSLNIRVEKCDSFDIYFSEFLIPYFKATDRLLKDKVFYKKGWDLDVQNIYSYWVAKDSAGEVLGFLGTYRYDNVATEIMSALSPLAFKQKIPVQDIMHWEIIKYHKNIGDSYFDLAGFNPNPLSEKEKNIKRFKEKWGGEVYDVSSYMIDNKSLVKKIILKIKRFLNSFKKYFAHA